jgi:glycosyltransferase involved in cell wall biosynthesis
VSAISADHTFVVPAYGHSPHLRECLASLRNQTVPSRIVVATSTPSPEVERVCAELSVDYAVHGPNRGIGNDWNQALRQAKSRYATVAHQDDVYYPRFTERTLAALARAPGGILAFTDYEEFTDTGPRPRSRLLLIKQALLEFAFLGRSRIATRLAKTNALRFACPIPCPAVTLDTLIHPDGFDESYQVNLDWATWLAASRHEGAFVWVREPLMGHRIHPESETSAAILDGRRGAEDFRILSQLWPSWLARMIVRSYSTAYASNEVS